MSPEDAWEGRARAFDRKLMGRGQVTLRTQDVGELAGYGGGSSCRRTSAGFPMSGQERKVSRGSP